MSVTVKTLAPWLLCLQLACFATAALADDSTRYREVVSEALSEFKLGHFQEASTLFREAHGINPSARTLRGLGITAFQLRAYVDSVDYLQAALDDTRNPLTAAQRSEAREMLDRARSYVARYVVHLQPTDATLEVDGHAVTLRNGSELWLDPGGHEIVASAPGHGAVQRHVTVNQGGSGELQLLLSPPTPPLVAAPTPAVASGASAAPSPPVQHRAPQASSASLWPWVVMGGGAALLAGGLVTGLMSNSAYAEVEKYCNPDACTDPRAKDPSERAETLASVTDVLWITGAISAVGGLTWLLLSTGDTETQAADTASVGCGPTGCYGSVRSTF